MTILDTMHHDTHTPHQAMIDYGRARLTPPRFALRGDAEQLITHTTLQTPCRLEATGARLTPPRFALRADDPHPADLTGDHSTGDLLSLSDSLPASPPCRLPCLAAPQATRHRLRARLAAFAPVSPSPRLPAARGYGGL